LALWKGLIGRPAEDAHLREDVTRIENAHLGDDGAYYIAGNKKISPEEVLAYILARFKTCPV